MRPQLSYSFPSFEPRAFDNVGGALERLRVLGFSWVTFTPAWMVSPADVLRVSSAPAPPLDRLAAAVALAVRLGFHVRLEPHLEWESTLTGGPYEWRRSIAFAPALERHGYAGRVIAPLLGVLQEAAAAHPARRFVLTLGSELDKSLFAFAGGQGGWRELLERSEAAAPSVALSHKINHDALERRERAGAPETERYLGALHHTAVSFYPRLPLNRPHSWWRQPTEERHLPEIAQAFSRSAARIAERARAIGRLAIGEFGLGSADVASPWRFEGADFESMREVRRKYYLGFLEFLRGPGNPFSGGPATLWTAHHFDVLGLLPGGARFRDEAVESAIARYNIDIIET